MMTFRLLITLVLALSTAAKALPAVADPSGDVNTDEIVKPLDAARPRPPIFKPHEERAVSAAYVDVYRILGADNSCSRFYGGGEMPLHVLLQLYAGLRRETLSDAGIGIRMSGSYTRVTSLANGFSYRIFDKNVINARGPFFRSISSSRNDFSFVGRYPSNTREARALMLLHELGHLIKGADDNWLLPDDAGDARRGYFNTLKIERHCGAQLNDLRREARPASPEETQKLLAAARAAAVN